MKCSINFSVDLSHYFQMVSITIWRAAIGRFYNCSKRHFMYRSISFSHNGNVFDVLKFLMFSSSYYFDSLIFNFSIFFTFVNLISKVLKNIGKLCVITHILSYFITHFIKHTFFGIGFYFQEMLLLILALDQSLIKLCQFAIGMLTLLAPITLPRLIYYQPLKKFTTSILFVYLKPS